MADNTTKTNINTSSTEVIQDKSPESKDNDTQGIIDKTMIALTALWASIVGGETPNANAQTVQTPPAVIETIPTKGSYESLPLEIQKKFTQSLEPQNDSLNTELFQDPNAIQLAANTKAPAAVEDDEDDGLDLDAIAAKAKADKFESEKNLNKAIEEGKQLKTQLDGLKGQLAQIIAEIMALDKDTQYTNADTAKINEQTNKLLSDTKATIDKYNQSLKNLEISKQNLDKANKELDKANKELEISKQNLDKANKELDKADKELETSKQNLDKANKELETSKQNLDKANKELETSKQNLDKANKELETSKQNLDKANKELETSKQNLDKANKELDKATQKSDGITKVKANLDFLQSIMKIDLSKDPSMRGKILTAANEIKSNIQYVKKVEYQQKTLFLVDSILNTLGIK